jgi:hypothetical protein
MATKSFTEKQKEIVARKMGYQGPMEGFDKFLRSDPALERKYGIITEKFMAKGGAVTKKKLKMQEGGAVLTEGELTRTTTATPTTTAEPISTTVTPSVPMTAVWGPDGTMYASPEAAQATGVTSYSSTPVTVQATASTATASQIKTGTGQAGPAQTAQLTTAGPAQTAATPQQVAAQQYEAQQAAPAVAGVLEGVQAQQGEVSPEALAQAQTMDPRETALMQVQAEQARPDEYVQAVAPTRELQAGEMVEGAAVDWAKVEEQLSLQQAEQGVVTPEMTVQGQLNKLLTDFDAGNPPPWAAAAMRSATAQMAARGLGASSIAGQAIIQATLESAVPIAAADAATFERMGLQNLSNRQQMAVLKAQQRAQFLGQDFDQAFQTRVLNAAKISDIANMNFTAEVQVALENARLAQTVNLANLSNRQAVVMAQAAQMANLETQNLSNMQQAAVQNAQAFLQMDLTNLQYRQQTMLFKAQEMNQAILTDTAAQNAALQFNAASKQQADQFNANLASEVQRFNAAQTNAMKQFDVSQANALAQFNTQQVNARTEFNAANALQVAQANAQLATQVSLANTAAITQTNIANAQAANSMSTTVYNGQVQLYRDMVDYAWKSGEMDLERENKLAIESMKIEASKYAADKTVDAAMYSALGQLSASVFGKGEGIGLITEAAKAIFGTGGAVAAASGVVAAAAAPFINAVKSVFSTTPSSPTEVTDKLIKDGYSFIDYDNSGRSSFLPNDWNYMSGPANVWGPNTFVAVSPNGDIFSRTGTETGDNFMNWNIIYSPVGKIGSADLANYLWNEYGLD